MWPVTVPKGWDQGEPFGHKLFLDIWPENKRAYHLKNTIHKVTHGCSSLAGTGVEVKLEGIMDRTKFQSILTENPSGFCSIAEDKERLHLLITKPWVCRFFYIHFFFKSILAVEKK